MLVNSKKNNIENLDWTHVSVQVSDIRLGQKLYMLNLNIPKFVGNPVVFVNRNILEDRLNGYFLGKEYKREDVLNLKWNMYLSQGYFIKIDSEGNVEHFMQEDKNRFYVSFLEISGPLAIFSSVYKKTI